jgi:hypothetical protein
MTPALRLHQYFERDLIAPLAQNRGWRISANEVRVWVNRVDPQSVH